MKNIAEAYLQNMVETASPIDLIVMLYDKAITCTERAIELFDQRDDLQKRKEYIENIDRVYDIVTLLKASLDMEKGKEIAKNLNEIYSVILSTLVRTDKTKEELEKILGILKELRESWDYVRKTQR